MRLTCVTAVFNAVKSGNRENLIRCVKSIAALKTEHEHLVYDGASTDGTVEILRELEATTPNLKVVSEADSGLYSALNKGVRDAKGEWFYVLGCDDYIVDSKVLDDLLAWMPDADLVASPTYIGRASGLSLGGWKRRRLLTGMPYSHQGTLMKTALMRQYGGFDERYRIAADYDLVLKFHIDHRRIVFASKPYGVFSMGGISSGTGTEQNSARDAVITNFKLNDRAARVFRDKLQLPWGMMARLLIHPDPTLRLAACAMLARKVLDLRSKDRL